MKQCVYVVYSVVLLSGLMACGSDPGYRYPAATRTGAPKLPIYDNAIAPTTHTDREHYGMESKVITFLTPDTPRAVQTFNKDKLREQRWEYIADDGGVLLFSNEVACPLYVLDLTTTQTLTATKVTLALSPGGCER
jgi:hypothetical protein